MLFKRTQKEIVREELTKDTAMLIYELLKTKSPQAIRLEDGYSMIDIQDVLNEAKRIENEVNQKLSGDFEIAPPIYTMSDDGESVIDTPAEYYEPTTEYQLKKSISSDLLDSDVVVIDVRKWSDGNPDEEPTWFNFKKSFVDA